MMLSIGRESCQLIIVLLFTSATVVYKDLTMYFCTFTICGV